MTIPSQAAAEDSIPAETGKIPGDAAGAKAVIGLSPGQLMRRRFMRDRTGLIAGIVVLLFFLVSALAPVISWLTGKDAYTFYGRHEGLLNDYGYPIKANGGIDANHWFGLEPLTGRDVFTELIYAIRSSLAISVVVTLVVVVTAIVLGVTAGYLGGKTDYFIGRFTDLLLAFPSQLFMVAFSPVVTAFFVDPEDETPTYIRVVSLILVLWFLGWMGLARLLRGITLSLREREFIEAAKVTGASPWRIVRKELLPNLMTPILVQTTFLLPGQVTALAGLSFLGVGLVDPTPDWGRMFAQGAAVFDSDITYMFFPGGALVIFVVAFNLLGDSVRDAFDPKSGR
jgi:peptide/nickel transport system permease protein